MSRPKNYAIVTFGCQMNKSESERLATVFDDLGFSKVEDPNNADFVVMNACSVRQAAINRIWGRAKEIRKNTTQEQVKLILTGCLLPQDKKKLSKKFDFVFNIKHVKELVAFLNPDAYIDPNYFSILPKYKSKFQAFVPIMTGCDNFCTFCVVPFTKGREIYRTVDSLLSEIKKLAGFGCKEISLLGQNVNTYLPTDPENFSKENLYTDYFAKLLWEINAIEGVERIFYTAAHPKDMSDEVIDAFKLPSVVNFLHLALQSGDDQVLTRMNRKYKAADYAEIIKKLRETNLDVTLGTDIIVGFPGESDEQFEKTFEFYKEMDFDISYTAKYSPREGTPAAKFKDQIDLDTKKERWERLQVLMEEITLKKNQKYKDKIVSVLVDGYKKGNCLGNSHEYKRVVFPCDEDLTGQIVDVKVIEPQMWQLKGERVQN